MLVQLPNENDFLPMDIDMSIFIKDKEIGEVIFGWYNKTYIGIKKW